MKHNFFYSVKSVCTDSLDSWKQSITFEYQLNWLEIGDDLEEYNSKSLNIVKFFWFLAWLISQSENDSDSFTDWTDRRKSQIWYSLWYDDILGFLLCENRLSNQRLSIADVEREYTPGNEERKKWILGFFFVVILGQNRNDFFLEKHYVELNT